MKQPQSTQVLIVGAGPTGLTLACDLARRGVASRIIDATPQYFTSSRGKGIQPRSMEVFDDLGVIDLILASGRFDLPLRAYDGMTVLGDHAMHEGRFPTPTVPYASPLMIPQWRVEETLRGRLSALGGAVELATELTGFTQDDGGVTATLVKGGAQEQVQVAYLAGCDGGHSFVRKALGVGFAGETKETERMMIADVRIDGLDRDHWHVWPKAAGGAIMLCPLPGTDAFQYQAVITTAGELDLSLEAFQKLLEERTGRTDLRLRDATWLSLYRTNVRMVDRYRVGRVFLSGDAAHVHSPAGGQGMNTGIQDAYNLGWKLGQVLSGAAPALLDTYEEERMPIAAWLLGISSKLHRQMYQADPIVSRGAETLQLGLNYRGSSLARDGRAGTAAVCAGDRAPDAPCRDAAGAAVRLFDVFRGPHFTLLAFGAAHAETTAQVNALYGPTVRARGVVQPSEAHGGEALVDEGGHAHAGYGVEGDALVLIRPDGYIGLFVCPGSLAELEDYLRPWIAEASSGR